MNKRVYQWAGVAFAIFVACTQTPLLSIVFSFLILGIIPGTSLTVPDWVILLVYPALSLVALIWLRSQQLYIGEIAKPQPVVSLKKSKPTKTAVKTAKRATVAKRRPRTAI